MSNSNNAASLRFCGDTFDSMIDSLSVAFGNFNAAPSTSLDRFQWSVDVGIAEGVVALRGYHQDEFNFNVEATDKTGRFLSICMPRHGGLGVFQHNNHFVSDKDSVLIYQNNVPGTISLHGIHNVIDELLIPYQTFLRGCGHPEDLLDHRDLNLVPVVELGSNVGRNIKFLADCVFNGISRDGPLNYSPIALAKLVDTLSDYIYSNTRKKVIYRSQNDSVFAPGIKLKKALEYIEENISRPFSMHDVARHCCISSRTLEKLFKSNFGATPFAYIQKKRLWRAHLDLMDPNNHDPIKSTCLKWGFFHFGRFALAYKNEFGERPSETFKRSRK